MSLTFWLLESCILILIYRIFPSSKSFYNAIRNIKYYVYAIFSLQPCHVIYTDYRPTPLQHYIFPAGGDGLHLVVDENVRNI